MSNFDTSEVDPTVADYTQRIAAALDSMSVDEIRALVAEIEKHPEDGQP